MVHRLQTLLFEKLDSSSLVFFRIAFGAIIFWEALDYLAKGWVSRYWIEPAFNFKYSLFPWVQALPGQGMIYLHYVLAGLALLVALGLFYRPAMALLWLTISYIFLLDETRYLNHVYLTSLVSFLLIFIPLNRNFSLDKLFFFPTKDPTLPAWMLWLLRFQIGVPYFFGGVAKLNTDWLQGQPMRMWLSRLTDFPIVGHFFTEDWFIYLATYGGLLIDLLAVPLLLYKRTRFAMFLLLVSFHFLNARWFHIGIFPWMMIAATTLFLEPDWPKRLWQGLRRYPLAVALPSTVMGLGLGFTAVWLYEERALAVFAVGALAGAVLIYLFTQPFTSESSSKRLGQAQAPPRRRSWVLSLVGLWMLCQIVIPLRHYAIPGNSNWTEEGHRFAWHMLLRSKSGALTYLVTDLETGQQTRVDPRDLLPSWQTSRLAGTPHMIHQFAHYIKETYAESGFENVSVRAKAHARLNGRPSKPIIDPDVDLALEPKNIWHNPWILPLEEPLYQAAK